MEPTRRVVFSVAVSGVKNLSNGREDAAAKVRVAVEFPAVVGADGEAPSRRFDSPAASWKDDAAVFEGTSAATTTFERDVNGALLDALTNDPLRVLLFDCTDPAAEVPLGTATVPLDALATTAASEVAGSFPVVLPSTEPDAAPDAGPHVELSVRASDPLLSESERMRATWLTISVGPLAQLPPACFVPAQSASTCFYRFALWFHVGPEEDARRVFIGGGRIAQPQNTVDWQCTRKYFLNAKAAEAWRAGIADGSLAQLVFEVRRDLGQDFSDRVDDVTAARYRGHAVVELASLLQPGQTDIIGTFPVVQCDHGGDPVWAASPSKIALLQVDGAAGDGGSGKESDGGKKHHKSRSRSKSRGKTPAEGDQKAEPATGTTSAAATKEKPPSPHSRRSRSKSVSKSSKPSKLVLELEKALKADEEPKPYEKAETTLAVSITFTKPLVPLPPPPKEKLKASDFLPRRKQLPRFQQLREATQDFRLQLEQIVQDLKGEYMALFGTLEVDSSWDTSKEDRRKQFFYRLNSTPAYYMMKEKLKKAVIRVVREKFTKTSTVPKDEIVGFVNELYVFLVDQMHAVFNELATGQQKKKPEEELAEQSGSLLRMAAEYELAGNISAAARYHQRRVTLCKTDASVWYDYGLFCLRTGSASKGDEAFEEALAVSGNEHAPSFTALGCRAFGINNDKATAFIEEAAKLDGGKPGTLSQTALDFVNKDSGSETPSQLSLEEYEKLASFLLEIRAVGMAERLIASGISDHGSKPGLVLSLARLHLLNGRHRWAEEYAQRALDATSSSPSPWSLLAEVYSQLEHRADAISHLRKAVELGQGSDSERQLEALLKLGRLFLEAGESEDAKDMFVRACKIRPASCSFWTSVARACINLGEFEEAEKCLAEANILNVEDPDIWGLLCLTCLNLGRDVEADESAAHALQLGLSDPVILSEIGSAYLSQGNLPMAERVLRAAASEETLLRDVRPTKLLAESLLRQGRPQEALPLFQLVAQADTAPPADRDLARQRVEELKGH